MNTYAETLKNDLLSIIDEMESHELDQFVRNPGKDFTRYRKFGFSSMIRCILSLGSASLGQELLKYFQFDTDFPSVSAFVQQRQKILPVAFSELFRRFSEKQNVNCLFEGYRLLAADGSDIICPFNPKEAHAFPNAKCSLLHLNALYDVINKQYVDVIIQGKRESNETAAAITMVDRLSDRFPVIVVADRGFENWNFFAHAEERLFDYVVRLRASDRAKGILSGLHLPNNQEFDVTKNLVITRHSTGPFAVNPQKYKYITKQTRFDFIPDLNHPDYEMSMRLVSFQLDNGEYEVIATSLPETIFSAEKLKALYHLRWGIESSFRELKHTVGLASFHSKKADCIIQEIYARLIMYNFSMLIAKQIQISETHRHYKYLINFSQAIRICMEYFRQKKNSPPFDLKALLSRFTLPERKGRSYTRNVYPQGAKAFNYRLT